MAEERPVGRHLIADVKSPEGEGVRDAEGLMKILGGALAEGGFHCLESVVHRFEGGGFTGVILLAESHAAVHTYPELGYLALDIFTCGPKNPRPILDALVRALRPAEVKVREVERSP